MASSTHRRERMLHLESLEPRLALASIAGLLDTPPPVVRSVADTFGADESVSQKDSPVNGTSAPVFGLMSDS